MKKMLALTMALILAAMLMAGCGGTPSSGTSSSSAAPSSAGSSEGQNAPAEMSPVKYTYLCNGSFPEYPPDGGRAKQLMQAEWEKNLGITNTDYEVICVAGSDYSTKLNAMMSGGDTPDLFEINVSILQNLVDNGIIAAVDDYVAQMPHYQKLLALPGAKASYDNFMIDGKHYAFPGMSLEGPLNVQITSCMVLRTDWLENLKLEAPTTLDELHDVLVAFTEDDPDKNGKNDTYGLSGSKDSYFSNIFGAYGICMNGINSWTEVDGKLVHSTTLPETKEVLALLSRWYSEGLIDPDKFVIEHQQAKDKFIAGQIGVWETDVWQANDARVAWKTSDPDASCAMIAPPAGPDGKRGFTINPVKNIARVISQNCVDNHDADRFVKILDWMVNTDEDGGQRFVQYGVEGEHYTYDREADVIIQHVSDATENYAQGFSNPIRWLGVVDRRWIRPDDPRAVDLQINGDPDFWITSEFVGSVPAMTDYPDLFSKLWSEYFTKIITGALPVDAFDEYVQKFYAQGGTELTGQVNEAWSAKK